jgi:homocysteine S-methyltransferase
MTTPLSELLSRRGLVFFGTALATELERRGLDLSSSLWSARVIDVDPNAIVSVHLDAPRVGADVVSSASDQASRMGFARLGRAGAEADACITRAVQLARGAVAQHGAPGRLVAASLGPYGAVLADGSEFTSDYPLSASELADFHTPRVEAAWRGRPDIVLFETLPSMAEAVALVARRFPVLPFMASFWARAGALSHGERFGDVVARLEVEPNVVAVGHNCTAPDVIAPLLASASPAHVALAASPSSGETWNAVTRRRLELRALRLKHLAGVEGEQPRRRRAVGRDELERRRGGGPRGGRHEALGPAPRLTRGA